MKNKLQEVIKLLETVVLKLELSLSNAATMKDAHPGDRELTSEVITLGRCYSAAYLALVEIKGHADEISDNAVIHDLVHIMDVLPHGALWDMVDQALDIETSKEEEVYDDI